MVFYKVVLSQQVRRKDIPKIPVKDRRKVVHIIGDLAKDPRPKSARELTNRAEYKIRYRNYRILYLVEDVVKIVEVRRVMLRGEDYKT